MAPVGRGSLGGGGLMSKQARALLWWRIRRKDEVRLLGLAAMLAVAFFIIIMISTRGPSEPNKHGASSAGAEGRPGSKTPPNLMTHKFADKMLELLDTGENFTVFAPVDAALLQLSSIFHKYEEKEDEVSDFLLDILKDVTIPRSIISNDVRAGTMMREESLTGVIVLISRDPHSRKLLVNNLPCSKVDMKRNNTIVHLVEGLAVPIALEQAIAFADPDDLDPEVRPADGEGKDMDEHGEGQGKQFDEDPDIAEQHLPTAKANISNRQPVANDYASNIKLGQGLNEVEAEEDSDTRNRDAFVKESGGLMDVEEVGTPSKNGSMTTTNLKHNKEGKGKAGKSTKKKHGGSGDVTEDEEDDDEDDDDDADAGGGPLRVVGNVTSGEQAKVAAVGRESRKGEAGTGGGQDQGSQEGEESGANSFQWFSGLKFGSPGTKERESPSGDGKDEKQRRGIGVKTELRGTMKSQAKVSVEPLTHQRAEVFCSGRGRLTDGVCSCSVLFQGKNCEAILEFRELGVDGYSDELIMSVDLLYAELHALDANETASTGAFVAPGLGMLGRLVSEFAPAERLELRRALPPYDPLEAVTWDTCAVVGSSGSLLLQDLGEEIDAHEMVMRFNGAPAYGYEPQVGSKTTLRFSNPEFAGFKEGNETVVYHIWIRNRKAEIEHLLKFKRMFPRDPLLILDLGFVTSVFNALGFIPSIGYIGWAFALQKCRRVDLYGFFMGDRHGVRHHYYDNNSTSKGTEEVDKEFVAALDIADAELMWIAEPCLYDCRRSRQRCSLCLRVPLATLAQKSEWNETQIALNVARENAWHEFSQWEVIEKKRGLAARAKKQSIKARRRPRRYKKRKLPSLLEEWEDGSEVPWDTIIAQGRLGELSLRELLLYFRHFQVTVPPTRLQMLQSIRNHYFFVRRELSKHQARLYRPAD